MGVYEGACRAARPPVRQRACFVSVTAAPTCGLRLCVCARREQQGILKLRNILEGLPEAQFNGEEYMNMYTCVPGTRRLQWRTGLL